MIYCLGCKKHTNDMASRSVRVTKKVLRQKPKCSVCQSDKSRFKKKDMIKRVVKFYKTCRLIAIIIMMKNKLCFLIVVVHN